MGGGAWLNMTTETFFLPYGEEFDEDSTGDEAVLVSVPPSGAILAFDGGETGATSSGACITGDDGVKYHLNPRATFEKDSFFTTTRVPGLAVYTAEGVGPSSIRLPLRCVSLIVSRDVAKHLEKNCHRHEGFGSILCPAEKSVGAARKIIVANFESVVLK